MFWIVAFAAMPALAQIVAPERVTLATREIRVRDVVDLRGAGVPARAGSVVLARLEVGQDRWILPRTTVATLVRRALPALPLEPAGPGVIAFQMQANRTLPAKRCLELAVAARRSDHLWSNAAAPVPCDSARAPAQLLISREQEVRAGQDLPAGTYLGALRLEPQPQVAKMEQLTFSTKLGTTSVDRQVVAMQSSRQGKVFVRSADGDIFALPVRSLRALDQSK